MRERIVVVGAGQAGASLVTKLRELGFDGPLTLIGDEPVPPYQRPPLSKKFLLGQMEEARLYLRRADVYDEQRIDLRVGTTVDSIDRDHKAVILASGERIGYDKLAFATGATPRRLPAAIGGHLDGVYTLRSIADVDAMRPEFQSGRRLLVVGGGYIGLEAAAVAAMQGLQVTLIEMAPRILQRVAAEPTSDYFRALHTEHGVAIREATGITRLVGENGRVSAAELGDGETLPVDFVIVGIGIQPNSGLAADAGLATTNGIQVDAQGRSVCDPAIFAAGDCAVFPFRGEPTRLESVQNAIEQAEAVAATMLGSEALYVPVPWFWSDQFKCKLQIAGLNRGYARTIVRPGAKPGAQSVWYFSGSGRVLAVDAMNDPRAYMAGKRWLEARQSPTPAMIEDPAADLLKLAPTG
ncbi:MAG: FAD-dependent oxidoreductase [Alphaproteobacteria bacterium]|nr:FAD-dependent oxidoreductase [Alphaproteobacteria bacterium]MCB9930702.1 FAD-dependent oxidoreductase [Alphaproteobacteria bacterium]